MTNTGKLDRLVEKLKAVRQAHAQRPEDECREALQQVLREELAGAPEDEAGQILDSIRAALIEEARRGEERLRGMEAEVSRLRSELEALRSERERLVQKADARLTPEAALVPLEKIRKGLREAAENRSVPLDSLGLSTSEEAIFRFMQELLRFAIGLALNIQEIRSNVGAASELTIIERDLKKMIRDRFRACLDGKVGSLDELHRLLEENQGFPLQLYDAYWASVRHGIRALLTEVDPEPIRGTHTGAFMFDAEGAFKELERKHSDLFGRPTEHIWEEFFFETFQQKLARKGESENPTR